MACLRLEHNMKIINPIVMSDSYLVASTVPETDYAEWSSSTSYVIGDKVIRTSLHKVFEAVGPSTGSIPESSPTVWLEIAPTNRWACFDQKIGTATTQLGGFSYTLRQSLVTGLALVSVVAGYAKITMTDDTAGVVYDKLIPLVDLSSIVDWYSYFYGVVKRKDTLVLTDLPSYRFAQLMVELIDDAGSTSSLGALVTGQVISIGKSVELGASSKIVDYSRTEFDDFGNLSIVKRAYSKRLSMDVWLPASEVDFIQSLVASLRATPLIFIGDESYAALQVYGFYKSFDISIRYPTYSVCSIDIEGLT